MKHHILSLLLLFSVYTLSAQNTSFTHYTPAELDATTLAVQQQIKSSNLVPRDETGIQNLIKMVGYMSYHNYAGKIPLYTKTNNIDSVVGPNGWKTIKMTRKQGEADYILIYIHGGAFYMNFSNMHANFCEALIKSLNAEVYMPLYPLAPQNNLNAGMEMLLDLYHKLLPLKKPIFIMGESAGGNLALSFTLYLKSLGEPLPAALFPISPMVDFTLTNPQIAEVEKRDIMLTMASAKSAYIWVPEGMNLKNPLLSPTYGDLRGMPRTLFFLASDDILTPDAIEMFEKMKAAGVEVGMLYGRDLWHASPVYPIPARKQYINEVIKFIK